MRNLIAPALILSALALPAAAQADPVSDCASDGSVDGNYTNAQLKSALNNIPGDVDEYSDCRAAIQAAMKSGGTKKKSSGKGASAGASSSGGTSTADDGSGTVTPVDLDGDGKISAAERKAAKNQEVAKKDAGDRKATESKLGSQRTDPTRVGALDASDTSNGIPTPVVLAIVALALLALAAGTVLIGRRRPGFAQALRRGPIPKRFRR